MKTSNANVTGEGERREEPTTGSGYPASDVRLEKAGDLGNSVDEVTHKLSDGTRFTTGFSFAERYLECRLDVWLVFTVSGRNFGQDKEHVARFEFSPTGVRAGELHRRNGNASEADAMLNDADTNERHEQGAVLVDVVQLAERGEQFVPSLIRLHTPDEFFNLRSNLVYGSMLYGFLGIVPALVNRKFSSWALGSTFGSDQLPREVVERGAKVVQGVAECKCDDVGDILCEFDIVDLLTGFHIVLDGETIRLTSQEPRDMKIKIIDVLFGPFNL